VQGNAAFGALANCGCTFRVCGPSLTHNRLSALTAERISVFPRVATAIGLPDPRAQIPFAALGLADWARRLG
jgi:hypothetical protein